MKAAQRDPNYFVEYVGRDELGEPLRQADFHRKAQDFLTLAERALEEWPRDHGKTTQITVLRTAWEIGHRPNIRAKVVCNTDSPAKKRVAAIIKLMQTPAYKRVFPEVRIVSQGTTSLTVKRASGAVDPTLEAFGVMSSVTGGRCDLLVGDDFVDASQAVSSTKREAVKKRWTDDWLNTVEPTGRVWVVYTPWHVSDATADMEKNPRWQHFRMPIVGTTPIWPEKWTEQALRDRKEEVGSSSYARGYELRRMADDDVIIKPEYFGFYTQLPQEGYTAVIGGDLAISEKDSACYTVFVVLYVLHGVAYLVDAIRGHWNFPEQKRQLKELAGRHGVSTVFVESNQYQAALGQALIEDRVSFGVASVNAVSSKTQRASELAVKVENKRLLLPADPRNHGQVHPRFQWLWDELTQAPFGDYWDGVDATGHAVKGALQGAGASEAADWGTDEAVDQHLEEVEKVYG